MQDPLDPALAPSNFAQPMVFFRLDPLAQLAVSSVTSELTHFRLRIPGRQVGIHLSRLPQSFPLVEHLDLSTDRISENDVEQILGQLRRLQILILDGCPVVSQRADTQLDAGEPFQQWASLGKTMALAGVKYAKNREKKLQAWLAQAYAELGLNVAAEPNARGRGGAPAGTTRGKRGRRGLATATISLRAPSSEHSSAPRSLPPITNLPPLGQKIRVLPSAPTIASLTATVPPNHDPEVCEAIRAQFENGWVAGIAQLSAICTRLQTSWRNGVTKVVRSADYETLEPEEIAQGDEGMAGLEYVEDEGSFAVSVVGHAAAEGSAAARGYPCPMLCLAGPGRNDSHFTGCGHQRGWDIWGDDV